MADSSCRTTEQPGGVFPKDTTADHEATVIPPGVTWMQGAVTEFSPENNCLLTAQEKQDLVAFMRAL